MRSSSLVRRTFLREVKPNSVWHTYARMARKVSKTRRGGRALRVVVKEREHIKRGAAAAPKSPIFLVQRTLFYFNNLILFPGLTVLAVTAAAALQVTDRRSGAVCTSHNIIILSTMYYCAFYLVDNLQYPIVLRNDRHSS